MSRFLTRCVLFLVAFFVLDKGLIFLRNRLPERELDKRLEYIITGKINADIVVMGSSRGARDIIASQLSDSLDVSAYNLSYPGSDVYFHEYLLEQLIKKGNKKPKLLVIAVDDPLEVKSDPTLVFRFDRLYPLVKYESVRNSLIEKGGKNRVLSEIFIIHQLSVSNFDPRKKKFNAQDTLLNDGSMPISWQSKTFNQQFASKQSDYDSSEEVSSKIASFRNIIRICTDNQITVLLAFAPNFSNPTIGFVDRMKVIAGNNCHIMQYDTTSTVYRDPDYYFDFAHLNLNGATCFTAELALLIKREHLLNTKGGTKGLHYLKS